MERKQFFVVAASAGAALAAAGIAANASDSSTTAPAGCAPGTLPHPPGSPRPHVPHAAASSVDSAYRHVERVVEGLSRDPNDYGGHKTKALVLLTQAQSELSEAVAYEKANPTATASPL